MVPFVVDSGVFKGAFNPRDQYHKQAAPIVGEIGLGRLGTIIITDYIFDEILTFIRKKSSPIKSVEAMNAILDSEYIVVDKITEEIFNLAMILFETKEHLSFTDAITVIYMKSKNITDIISFDTGFDTVEGLTRHIMVPTSRHPP